MERTRLALIHEERIIAAHGARDVYKLMLNGRPVLEIVDWLADDVEPLELHIIGRLNCGEDYIKLCNLCKFMHELLEEAGGSLLLPLPTPQA